MTVRAAAFPSPVSAPLRLWPVLALLAAGAAQAAAPAVDGAVVLSMRGDDFELYSGQDFSIGFHAADRDTVDLYIEESLTFHVHSAEAAVALRSPD